MVHGHAPRVRHRQSIIDDGVELVFDKQALLNKIVGAAIGTVVGLIITNKIFRDAK